MYLLSSKHTMAGAKRIVADEGINIAPKRRRQSLIEMSRKWQAEQAAKKAREDQLRIQDETAGMNEAERVEHLIASYREIEIATGKKPVRQIILEVAQEFGVPAAVITGINRSRRVVAVRHEAIYRARMERPDLSLPQIGKAFGGRDHTTILHAIKKIERQRRAA